MDVDVYLLPLLLLLVYPEILVDVVVDQAEVLRSVLELHQEHRVQTLHVTQLQHHTFPKRLIRHPLDYLSSNKYSWVRDLWPLQQSLEMFSYSLILAIIHLHFFVDGLASLANLSAAAYYDDEDNQSFKQTDR